MKKIKNISPNILLWLICLIGTIFHWAFLSLNDVMKIADSFAYLLMSYHFWDFSSQWLWNGWFGFIYSLPIALVNLITNNDFLAAQIVNLILLNVSAILLWKISRSLLSPIYSLFVIVLFFLSPTLLHFNIHILTENIYIPLFLGLFILLQKLIAKLHPLRPSDTSPLHKGELRPIIYIGCMIGLMYLTRAEAFIYLSSIGIISLILLFQKRLSIWKFFWYAGVFFISFFIFISPYLIYLNGLTGEWGLTNKWASNLRQAELRGQEKMDDAWFEQAVAELTADKHHLIAGFAGGMPYDAPSIEWSLWEYVSKDPNAFFKRIMSNQKKLYTQNFPEIILWKSPSLYYWDDSRFSNIFFLLYCLVPFLVLIFGIYKVFQKQRDFFVITIAFFIPASIFFTLFFTLNRYFLIFLPLIFITLWFGLSQIRIWKYSKLLQIWLSVQLVSLLLLSTLVYYNTESPKDDYYRLKKTAGEWLQSYCTQEISPEICPNSSTLDLKIMERFPIVSYYSGSKTRYITPYTNDIADIYEYGSYHNIDILVVDTMDFKTYRPELSIYLDTTPDNFIRLQEFTNPEWQKVILYQLKK